MPPGALLTDFYQLNMLDGYLQEDLQGTAVFKLFVRRLPEQRHFLVTAGLEQALDFLEHLAFTEAQIAWLQAQGVFSPRLVLAAPRRQLGREVALHVNDQQRETGCTWAVLSDHRAMDPGDRGLRSDDRQAGLRVRFSPPGRSGHGQRTGNASTSSASLWFHASSNRQLHSAPAWRCSSRWPRSSATARYATTLP